MKQRTFILIGRSGCGKGTQGKLIEEELKKQDPARGVFYLQSGAKFREFIGGEKYTNHLSKAAMEAGLLQPEFLAVYMWADMLIGGFTGGENMIMDGMPRKFHEAGVLDSIFDFYTIDRPLVIYINVSKETSVDRMMARGRGDDTRVDIESRLSWFETDVIPTIEYYRNNKAYRLVEIDGERNVEEVWADLKRNL